MRWMCQHGKTDEEARYWMNKWQRARAYWVSQNCFARARTFSQILLLSLCCTLAGCQSIGYLGQAASGQLRLLSARQKVSTILADTSSAKPLKRDLHRARSLLDFAQSELGLHSGKNYRHYVKLPDRYVLWNVFVAPRFSLSPVRWCFPVAGCVPYRGYFREQQALRYAARQASAGFDVYVGGVSAYSTLGWFSDPLLSSFLHGSDIHLAGILFHELAHSVMYAPGDSEFNESFATLVEQRGVCLWLTSQQRTDDLDAYSRAQATGREFALFIRQWRARLAALYAGSLDSEALASARQMAFAEMRQDYNARKSDWPDQHRYDAFMGGTLNNARLNTATVYLDKVAPLRQLLAEQNHDLQAFYAAVLAVAALNQQTRNERLQALRDRFATKEDNANTGDNCSAY